MKIVDGNEAAARVAYAASEAIAIYPITPASPMGELADVWSSSGRPNLWGGVPRVVLMQSEGGAAGAAHGILQAGALAATFTSSQGLLLMIPNMYKIAGELTPFVIHVAARAVATHALSIFGDHSDVMACRQTGFAMLASGSVQEAQDLAAVAHAATLRTRIPFLHFFDGFRTSHELAKIEDVSEHDLGSMIDPAGVRAHRERALTPDRPAIRGTAQNPDVFFQAREAANPFYLECPGAVESAMIRFSELTGRRYRLFDYAGHPEAERVIVLMGSGAETAHETADWLLARGEKVGVLKVRLYRPFSLTHFIAALPASAKAIAALDRTKEPGSLGEPLYLDVVAALREARDRGLSPWREDPKVIGGRYGLASKEFTPAMVKAVFDELSRKTQRNHFTVGIIDDVTRTSLDVDPDFDIESDETSRAVFFGLGSDGTVSANKSSVHIIGEATRGNVQGYFVYDSKKAGAHTAAHLRFGPRPIRSSYLLRHAQFIACHHFPLLEQLDVLALAAPGAAFLLNALGPADAVWARLPRRAQERILEKKLRLYVIDAQAVATKAGLGRRINTVMQACFFALSGAVAKENAVARIKERIAKAYAKAGLDAIRRNFAAVDQALQNLREIAIPADAAPAPAVPATISGAGAAPILEEAPDFVKKVTSRIMAGQGDLLPVSAFPVDGTWPVGTSRWEKRNLALDIPVWDPALCIQCNKCAFVCPHAAIRANFFPPERLKDAPAAFKSAALKSNEFKNMRYALQVAPEDCTGCALCVTVCPAKDKSEPARKAIGMAPVAPLRETERENYRFFLELPEPARPALKTDVKDSQFLRPLFEYSGACAGCGETPYIKLLTQLFGDRLLIANATGCSSIFGGNLPATPYAANPEGRGPAWSNSLFEDNAEFGLGLRLGVDSHAARARELLRRLQSWLAPELVQAILAAKQNDAAGVDGQRARVRELRSRLAALDGEQPSELSLLADYLVRKSVWIVGGDGWAYDIGFGGLDHVLASGRDVKVLVLDTEVYSNTGGQQSKATPLGASAKFAAAGKELPKKDLGLMAMTYGNVYVARVAFGAKDAQTVQAVSQAESYPGPALVIAYAHCVAHGYDLALGAEHQKLTVESGVWPLYRFDPRLVAAGKPPLQLDSAPPKISPRRYMLGERRFKAMEKSDPERFEQLLAAAEREAARNHALYRQLAGIACPRGDGPKNAAV